MCLMRPGFLTRFLSVSILRPWDVRSMGFVWLLINAIISLLITGAVYAVNSLLLHKRSNGIVYVIPMVIIFMIVNMIFGQILGRAYSAIYNELIGAVVGRG
ncbi:hypothetical protein KSX_64200 [Ktedonospora formicarum]|uniref:Uncharacterized protein n=1 Tax=Ktedonospora formicarum TaxID=2778364 RepID=A0A8J3I1F3_9CHLR|nr:hypothetical protein KSX_64200 [Ktedonospora formicarum]